MNEQEALIHQFYRSFQKRDVAAMNACYHSDIHFTDEVFDIRGKEVHAMWHMLIDAGSEMKLSFSDISASGNRGSAHWEPMYPFGKSKRMVHNKIDSEFTFKDGLIVRHQDSFDFWRWSRMALGAPGMVLGWTPFMRKQVQDTVKKRLAKFIGKHPQYQS